MPYASPKQHVVQFGKHQGKTLGQIMQQDAQYVEWLANVGMRKDNSLRTHDQYSSITIKDPAAVPAANACLSSSSSLKRN